MILEQAEARARKAQAVVPDVPKFEKKEESKPSVQQLSPDVAIDQPQQDAAFQVKRVEPTIPDRSEADCTPTCSPTQVQPVCGSDGQTYLNPCLLNHRACEAKKRGESKTHLQTLHWGYCPVAPPGRSQHI